MSNFTLIPQEMRDLNQWNFSFSLKEIRRPKYTKYEHNKGFSFEQAVKAYINSGNKIRIMFYTTLKDPYIIGDLDHIENVKDPFAELPPNLAYLLKAKPTYTEVSSSGKGLRFIYKLTNSNDKKRLNRKVIYGSEIRANSEKQHTQINMHGPGMTITGKRTSYSTKYVTPIELKHLEKAFIMQPKKSIPDIKATKPDSYEIPDMIKIKRALANLPLDQNPRIQRAYEKTFKSKYQHYDYWLKVMMALHNYAERTDDDTACLDIFIQWSRQDEESFKGVDDIQRHWVSLSGEGKGNIVKYNTLLSLNHYNRITWKHVRKQKKEEIEAGIPPKPNVTQYSNFEVLLNFYNIKMFCSDLDFNMYFLTGDEDIMEEHFMLKGIVKGINGYYGPFDDQLLKSGFQMFAQEHGLKSISMAKVQENLINTISKHSKDVNMLKEYIDTPYTDLPVEFQDHPEHYGISNVDYLFNCLDINYLLPKERREEEHELYRSYYRKWLMGVIRGQYYEGDYRLNNCILILSGIEQEGKSSHFMFMLPKFFRHHVTLITESFSSPTSLREIGILASQYLFICWDDNINKYITPEDEDNFKRVIDNPSLAFRDKFRTHKTHLYPFAIYGATSNKTEFNIGDDGSRRLFIIPVLNVDHGKILRACWHPILNELKKEMFEGITDKSSPWMLTEEELELQTELHRMTKSKNDLDMVLHEIYDTSSTFRILSNGTIPGVSSFQDDKSGTFKSMIQVFEDLERHGHNTFKITRPALKRALQRVCGAYTHTLRRKKNLPRYRCIIFKGLAEINGKKRWVLPPLLDETDDQKHMRQSDIDKETANSIEETGEDNAFTS